MKNPDTNFIFTNPYNQKMEVKKFEIDSYRGGTEFTTIYLKNGNVLHVKESFEQVDKLLNF